MNIKLNCDMGESFGIWKMGLDEKIMPHISLANLACGFHASDALNMNKTVELAKKYNVLIGAHPSYHDLVGFGRRSIKHTLEEIESIVLYQLGALQSFCKKHDTKLSYIKPHGALYNDMMQDMDIYQAILEAIKAYDNTLKLMILSSNKNETFQERANEYGIELLFEAFLDRNYLNDGSLVPRTNENAVIHDEQKVIQRVKLLQEHGYIESINNDKLHLKVDTLCVHGDTDEALNFILKIKDILN